MLAISFVRHTVLIPSPNHLSPYQRPSFKHAGCYCHTPITVSLHHCFRSELKTYLLRTSVPLTVSLIQSFFCLSGSLYRIGFPRRFLRFSSVFLSDFSYWSRPGSTTCVSDKLFGVRYAFQFDLIRLDKTRRKWILTAAVLRRAATVRLFRDRLGKFADSSVADRSDGDYNVAGSLVLLQRNRRARVGKIEVLIFAVEIVIRRQRLVTNLHLRMRNANTHVSQCFHKTLMDVYP